MGHTQPPIKWVPTVCSQEARQLGPEVDHSAPSRARVKAEWNHTYGFTARTDTDLPLPLRYFC